MHSYLLRARALFYRLILPREVRDLLIVISRIQTKPSVEDKVMGKRLAEQMGCSQAGWLKIEAEMDALDSPFGDVIVAANRVACVFGVANGMFHDDTGELMAQAPPPRSAQEQAMRLEKWRSMYPNFDPKAADRLWVLTKDLQSYSVKAERLVGIEGWRSAMHDAHGNVVA